MNKPRYSSKEDSVAGIFNVCDGRKTIAICAERGAKNNKANAEKIVRALNLLPEPPKP